VEWKTQSILKREAARYYKTHVKLNRALGELDHPNPTSKHFRQLCTESVSHRVRENKHTRHVFFLKYASSPLRIAKVQPLIATLVPTTRTCP